MGLESIVYLVRFSFDVIFRGERVCLFRGGSGGGNRAFGVLSVCG